MADQAPPAEAAGDAAAAAVAKLHLDEVTGEMISKTELKKRQKLREKEAAKKEKAAKAPPPAAGASAKSAEAAERDLTPNQVNPKTPSSLMENTRKSLIYLTYKSTLKFDHAELMSCTRKRRLIPTRYVNTTTRSILGLDSHVEISSKSEIAQSNTRMLRITRLSFSALSTTLSTSRTANQIRIVISH